MLMKCMLIGQLNTYINYYGMHHCLNSFRDAILDTGMIFKVETPESESKKAIKAVMKELMQELNYLNIKFK